MTVSDSLPKPRLKIKFSCKTTTQAVLKTGSCEASKQLWINENCVSLNGNKDSMRKQESRKAAPHSCSDSLKLIGVDNINDGSPVRRSSVKRGPSGVIDTVLNKRQKMMDRSLKRYCGNILEALIKHPTSRGFCEPVDLCPRESPLTVGLAPMMSMSFEEKKRKLTKDPGEAMPEKVTDYVKISNARPANEEAAARKILQNSRCPGKVVLRKGTVSGNRRSTCGSVKTIASFNVVATRCGSCGSLKCECCHQKKGYAYESSNNLPCERYMGQNCVASKMEHESSLTSNNTCKSDPESDVAVSALDEENNCSSPQPSSGTTAASADGWTPAIGLQLSPNKALRAAMLKKRFADTILKAKQKQKSLLDPINLRRLEKEKLERQQQEEKARIEDQIRAAKVASSLKAQGELRLSREREREAARIALQEMEKTVEIEDNMKVLKELEIILFKARQGDRFGNMMERIGLFLKNDYMDYEDEEDGLFLQDLEEGQICN